MRTFFRFQMLVSHHGNSLHQQQLQLHLSSQKMHLQHPLGYCSFGVQVRATNFSTVDPFQIHIA
ncbi:Uncharacterised protein [Vibrio cholerae]|nr:Uncharacterised protein [Vibrio cholerae]